MTQSGSGQILVFDLGLRLDEPSIKSKAHDMADEASPRLNPTSAPLDDPQRSVCVADSDDPNMRHFSVFGDTYTILVTGEETGGRYSLIDAYVPDGAGPPAHRHDCDESFTVLEGELEITVRGQAHRVLAGSTITVPSNAPHFFRNKSGKAARILCVFIPPGMEEFLMALGVRVDGRTASAPMLTEEELEARMKIARPLAAKCRLERLTP